MDEIMEKYGMEDEEVVRLANRAGIPMSEVVKNSEWSQSWVPKA